MHWWNWSCDEKIFKSSNFQKLVKKLDMPKRFEFRRKFTLLDPSILLGSCCGYSWLIIKISDPIYILQDICYNSTVCDDSYCTTLIVFSGGFIISCWSTFISTVNIQLTFHVMVVCSNTILTIHTTRVKLDIICIARTVTIYCTRNTVQTEWNKRQYTKL